MSKPTCSHSPGGTLLILSQVYRPDPASVGQHVADVAEAMAARGLRVVVYTSGRGYDDPSVRYPLRERLRGVEVRRLPLSSFGKGSIPVRLLAQASFLLQASLRGLLTRRLSLVLVSTSPPFAGLGGTLVAWLRRVPLVWWVMDLNPDQMIAAGKLSSRSLPARVFDGINRATLRRARDVVILDRFMSHRLLAKLPVESKVRVIPPWPHEDHLATKPAQRNAFRVAQGWGDAFVIMYSGNHALQHPLETLLDAARHFESAPNLLFVFIGGGAGKTAVERRIAAGATNLRSLPYQPLERLGDSLSAADVHVVSMGDDMVGIVHPCKVYGAMSVAKPILYFGPRDSHIGDILTEHPVGEHVPHGDVAAAVNAIKRLQGLNPQQRAEHGNRAAQVAATTYSRSQLLGQFCDLLQASCSGINQRQA